jgi:hypothetical protein
MTSQKNLASDSKANLNNQSSSNLKDGDNAATTNDQALAIED